MAQIKNVESPMKKQWLPHGSMFLEQTANKGKKHYARCGHQQHWKKVRKQEISSIIWVTDWGSSIISHDNFYHNYFTLTGLTLLLPRT